MNVSEVAESVADRDRIERIVGEREAERVTSNQLHWAGLSGGGVGNPAEAFRGDLEHRPAEIEPDDARPSARQRPSHIPRSATEVKRASARRTGNKPGETALPASVETETLDVVDQVVPAGDAGEERVDLGPPIAWLVELVGHAAGW